MANNISAFNNSTPITAANAAQQGGALAQNFMAPNFNAQTANEQTFLQNQGLNPK